VRDKNVKIERPLQMDRRHERDGRQHNGSGDGSRCAERARGAQMGTESTRSKAEEPEEPEEPGSLMITSVKGIVRLRWSYITSFGLQLI
jgi:hypothetical protein